MLTEHIDVHERDFPYHFKSRLEDILHTLTRKFLVFMFRNCKQWVPMAYALVMHLIQELGNTVRLSRRCCTCPCRMTYARVSVMLPQNMKWETKSVYPRCQLFENCLPTVSLARCCVLWIRRRGEIILDEGSSSRDMALWNFVWERSAHRRWFWR